MITLEALRDLLDRHGAAPGGWPADRCDAALALIAADPRALAEIEAARRLEAVLGRLPVPEPPSTAAVVAGVMARVGPAPEGVIAFPTARRQRGYPAIWLKAAALLAACLAGLAVGLGNAAPPAEAMPLLDVVVADQAVAAADLLRAPTPGSDPGLASGWEDERP